LISGVTLQGDGRPGHKARGEGPESGYADGSVVDVIYAVHAIRVVHTIKE